MKSVEAEEFMMLSEAPELAGWEFQYLDTDGGTTRIVNELTGGKDIFWSERSRVKYGRSELARWEAQYLVDHGGTSKNLKYLVQGRDIFWSGDARSKCGHLSYQADQMWRQEQASQNRTTLEAKIELTQAL